MLIPAGEIRDMTIPWLFQELRAGKKSGTAIFEQDVIMKKVYFSNGDILFASSNIDDDRLGEFLLSQGRISRAQFDSASVIVKKTNKKLGAVLLELCILSPRDLVAQVKLQVKQIILTLFSLRNGQYRFEEGLLKASEIIPLQMSTGSLILDGVQALDWQVIRKSLPPLKTVLRPSVDPALIFQKADLSPDQKTALSFIDGGKNIEQVCGLTGIGDFNTLKAIYVLLALKITEVGKITSDEEKRFAKDAVYEAVKIEEKDSSAMPVQETIVTKQSLLKAFAALKHQDHFQVLGVDSKTSAHDLKIAYFRSAKMYHPDRHFEPEMADMKETLEALFSRIHDAYQILSDPARRREFEQTHHSTSAPSQYEEKRAEQNVENYAEKTGQASAYFNSGMKEYTRGNYWGAADNFAWAARLDPVKAAYYYFFGLSLVHIPRRRHEAEENLQKAIQIDPLRPEYYLDLGALYLKSGLKTKALDVYSLALKENPNSEKIQEAIKAAKEMS